MLWKPINFQGIIVIDKELVDQLHAYLDEKSVILANRIVNAFRVEKKEEELAYETTLSLEEAIKVISSYVDDLIKAKKEGQEGLTSGHWRTVRDALNQACWKYVEILEGCAVEFLQQLDNVRLDRLTLDVLQAIDSVRILVIENGHRAVNSIKTTNGELKRYRDACQPRQSLIHRCFRRMPWRYYILDRSLLDHLCKTEEALDHRDQELRDAYQEYNRLSLKIQGSLHKLERYQALKSLDSSIQDKFCEMYRFLKMWKINQRTKALPDQDFTRILRSISTPESVIAVFKEYHASLMNSLFQVSRSLKSMVRRNDEELAQLKRKMRTQITGLSSELHSLGSSIGRFRDFLLRTDPNPYVRSRWGFSEWVVGPEPKAAKELMQVGYEVESLDAIFFQLKQSLQKDEREAMDIKSTQWYSQIQNVIHEMGQPLASPGMMRKSADNFVDLLGALDELGSTNSRVVNYVSEVLSKSLRADWKYHVLHDIPRFHQLYHIHLGIVGPCEDPAHRSYCQKMKSLWQQLKEWTKAGTILSHVEEISSELEKLKVYLQDFFSKLHKIEEGKELTRAQILALISRKRQQLLEYRYLFGTICQQILQNQQGSQLRNQYLFIDQYFEFIENKLNEVAANVR